jgi:hypothetical protein
MTNTLTANNVRKAARMVGFLYINGTVSGILSAVFTGSLFQAVRCGAVVCLYRWPGQ